MFLNLLDLTHFSPNISKFKSLQIWPPSKCFNAPLPLSVICSVKWCILLYGIALNYEYTGWDEKN